MGGAWVAQLAKRLTLDFSSGYDLHFMRLSPPLGSALTARSRLGFSLSFPLCLSPAHTSLRNKQTFKKRYLWGT